MGDGEEVHSVCYQYHQAHQYYLVHFDNSEHLQCTLSEMKSCYTVFLTTHSVSFGMGNNMAWGVVEPFRP